MINGGQVLVGVKKEVVMSDPNGCSGVEMILGDRIYLADGFHRTLVFCLSIQI